MEKIELYKVSELQFELQVFEKAMTTWSCINAHGVSTTAGPSIPSSGVFSWFRTIGWLPTARGGTHAWASVCLARLLECMASREMDDNRYDSVYSDKEKEAQR